MYYPAQLIFKSYIPFELKKGMLFINVLHSGTFKETYELWTLKEIPSDINKFLEQNGAPIDLFIIDEDEENTILASPEEIGWFDFGEEISILTDISLKELNIILNEYDGYVDIDIDEEDYENGIITPLQEQNKVVLKFIE